MGAIMNKLGFSRKDGGKSPQGREKTVEPESQGHDGMVVYICVSCKENAYGKEIASYALDFPDHRGLNESRLIREVEIPTANKAEILKAIAAVNICVEEQCEKVETRSSSTYLVSTIPGNSNIKANKDLWAAYQEASIPPFCLVPHAYSLCLILHVTGPKGRAVARGGGLGGLSPPPPLGWEVHPGIQIFGVFQNFPWGHAPGPPYIGCAPSVLA